MIGFDSCMKQGWYRFQNWQKFIQTLGSLFLVSKNYSQFRTCISPHASTIHLKYIKKKTISEIISHCNAKVEDIETHFYI